MGLVKRLIREPAPQWAEFAIGPAKARAAAPYGLLAAGCFRRNFDISCNQRFYDLRRLRRVLVSAAGQAEKNEAQPT
jgi:hypothetical protein